MGTPTCISALIGGNPVEKNVELNTSDVHFIVFDELAHTEQTTALLDALQISRHVLQTISSSAATQGSLSSSLSSSSSPSSPSPSPSSILQKSIKTTSINTLKHKNVILKKYVLRQRNLRPVDVYGCFIDNTNLNSLPPNCLGTLIAYSLEKINCNQKYIYNLGVLIYLTPIISIVAPIAYNEEQDHFIVSDDIITIDFVTNNKANIIYLNSITHKTCGEDGFIESNPVGPDVILNYDNCPSSILKKKVYCHDI